MKAILRSISPSFIPRGNETKFLLLMLACLIDSADKSLLSSTLKAFESALQVGPRLLGLLTFYQSISFAVTLPLWGLALEYGWDSTLLLIVGCYGFGIVTCLLSVTSSYPLHCLLRILNGGFLCGIIPLSQGILSQLIPEDKRGSAFGLLAFVTSLAGLGTSYFATTSDKSAWRKSHLTIGMLSFVVAWAIWKYMPDKSTAVSNNVLVTRSEKGHDKGTLSRMYDTCKRIFKMKTFCLMVLQGLFGGVPWNAMSFLPMYWQTCGYSDDQAGLLGVAQSLGMALGGLLGGMIGDNLAAIDANRGRIITAQISVALGIPAFCSIFYLIPCDSQGDYFYSASILVFLFGGVSTWTASASLRPMCAELMSSPVEQGQIVALWVMLEGITSSVFGSPLVGWLTELYGYDNGHDLMNPDFSKSDSASALARSLVGVSTIAWFVCLVVWIIMLKTYPHDKAAATARKKLEDLM